MNRNKRVTVYVRPQDEDVWEVLETYCTLGDRSMSRLVTRAVSEYVENHAIARQLTNEHEVTKTFEQHPSVGESNHGTVQSDSLDTLSSV